LRIKEQETRLTLHELDDDDDVKLGTCNFEIVKDYTYLGTILVSKKELRQVMEKGIRNANVVYNANDVYNSRIKCVFYLWCSCLSLGKVI
jgi:hypothetical protein